MSETAHLSIIVNLIDKTKVQITRNGAYNQTWCVSYNDIYMIFLVS